MLSGRWMLLRCGRAFVIGRLVERGRGLGYGWPGRDRVIGMQHLVIVST